MTKRRAVRIRLSRNELCCYAPGATELIRHRARQATEELLRSLLEVVEEYGYESGVDVAFTMTIQKPGEDE